MAFEGFVFSDDSAELSDAEFEIALSQLDAVRASIEARDALARENSDAAKIFLPDDGWHPDSQPSFELDGSTKNAQTSYRLLAEGDRDIIAKMRLYGHAFTGYQLATLEFASKRPWLSSKLPENWDQFLQFLAGPPDRSVFNYVSVANALPERLRISPPRKFGEIGWQIDGTIVNDDTWSYQEIVCLLAENGLIAQIDELISRGKTPLIVEIGGGFGGLGYYLMKIFEDKLRYVIIDIPESLAFSAIYCATLFSHLQNKFEERRPGQTIVDEAGFSFTANWHYRSLDFTRRHADLVVNTLSLSEMSDPQIEDYCDGIKAMIGETGIFFEQNHQTNHEGPGGFCTSYFKNLRQCSSKILPDSFAEHRGQANLWVSAGYKGQEA
ncbi:MAG: putative sugar O-methyltransferase [Pseudomonadota bacterium]|nr:putative sugar O-methyltransferase [Pseudomonadota bacterium]